MDTPIIPRAVIRDKGARAFDAGVPFNGHKMNPDALALPDWIAGWLARQAEKCGKVTPP